MVQSLNSHDPSIEPNLVGGPQPNSPKVTENKTPQFETSVQKLQANFLNDAKLLKESRKVRSFGDIFIADMAGKGFCAKIAQFFTNIGLYRQDPEKLLHNVGKYTDELSEKIAKEYQSGKRLSKASTDAVLKFIKRAQVGIYEFKLKGQLNKAPGSDELSPREKEENADIAEYGEKLEQLIQPNRLFKGLQEEISTFTKSVIERCKTSEGLSSKDIEKLSSEIQSFEKGIQNLKDAFAKGLLITKKDPILPKTVQNFLRGLLREDIFLLKDFSKTLQQACESSETLMDDNFAKNFQTIAKLKSEFKDEGTFGNWLLEWGGDFANETAYVLKEAAFKSIDLNIKKFIGIDDFIAKTKNDLKEQKPNFYKKWTVENSAEFRNACCSFYKSEHITKLETFVAQESSDNYVSDIQKICKQQLDRLYKLTLVPKW